MQKNLLKTPTGYYFRMKVPKRHRDHFQRREFKKALCTTDPRDAQRKATLLAAIVDEHIAQLDQQKGYRMHQLPFFTGIRVAEVDVSMQGIKLVGLELDPLHQEAELQTYQRMLSIAREEQRKMLVSPTTAVTPEIVQPVSTAPELKPPTPPVIEQATQKLLAALIDDFAHEKTTSGKWKLDAGNGRKEQLLLGLEYFGDVDVRTINRDQARDYVSLLEDLPPNRKKNKAFKNMSLEEIAVKNVNGTKLSPKSINMNLTDTASFFKWCIRCGHADRNPFEGLSVKETSSAITQRLPYTHAELKILLSHEYFQSHNCVASEYFLPLLGLYHGARLNELCQLHTDDVYEMEEGLWVIDINDNGHQKSIKTIDSRRILPVHPELIRMNFIGYVNSLQPGRIFPNLEFKRGKFSGDYSKRFGTVRKRVGVKEKDFHSFRHLVSAELEEKGIKEHLVAAILGHQHPNITFARYGGPKKVRRLLKILAQMTFDIDVKPWPEIKIRRGTTLRKLQKVDPTMQASEKTLDEVFKLSMKEARRL